MDSTSIRYLTGGEEYYARETTSFRAHLPKYGEDYVVSTRAQLILILYTNEKKKEFYERLKAKLRFCLYSFL